MPYADYSGFDQSYFEGVDVATPNPAGYTDYSVEYFDFGQLASEISGKGTDPLIIVGAAYGFVMRDLPNGWDVAGMDISPWAVGESANVVGSGAIIEGDATSATDVSTLAGEVRGKPRWGVTECLFSCLTDSEAVTVADNLRSEAREVMHFVWTEPHPDYYNVKTLAEWQSLVDPDGQDTWIDFNDLLNYHPHA